MATVLDVLTEGFVVGDGPLELALKRPVEGAIETLHLDDTEALREAHERYLEVGARVLRTNTLRANGVFLEEAGFGDRVSEINWTAAKILTEVVKGHDAWAIGRVGPLGLDAEMAAEASLDREELFQDQIGALLDGGVRCICLEGFADLEELGIAVEALRSVHHCPAIGVLDAAAFDWSDPVEDFQAVLELDAEVVGCSGDAAKVGEVLGQLECGAVDAPVVAWLNDGDWLENVEDWRGRGVALVGGGMGFGPEGIAELADGVR